jgi:hypothetical protein
MTYNKLVRQLLALKYNDFKFHLSVLKLDHDIDSSSKILYKNIYTGDLDGITVQLNNLKSKKNELHKTPNKTVTKQTDSEYENIKKFSAYMCHLEKEKHMIIPYGIPIIFLAGFVGFPCWPLLFPAKWSVEYMFLNRRTCAVRYRILNSIIHKTSSDRMHLLETDIKAILDNATK